MTKTLMKIAVLFGLVALAVTPAAQAQATMTSTTLSTALASASSTVQSCFNVASATGITAPNFSTPNQPTGNQTLLVVNHEAIFVNSVTGTFVCGTRGYATTRANAHVSGATVWVGPPTAFLNSDPGEGNACTATALAYLPIVTVGGNTYDCLGVAPASVVVRTSSPGVPAVGSTVASATTITPTGTEFAVSGVTAVATINVPAGFAPGMQLFIRPTGIFATTTAGNIGLVTSATVVGRILVMTWDGTKFWPSYVT